MKAIFITVRTGSRRLPRKALLKINGRTTIEHVIDRAKQAQEADMIVLCTTTLPADTALRYLAAKNRIKCFRGSVEDKLDRWRGAAKLFGIDFFITFDGDDLLCDPGLADLAFRQYERTKADFIEAKNVPCGAFTYGVKVSALNRVCEIKGTGDTEMMVPYFTETGMFQVEKLENVPKALQRPEIRMTLDYTEDFDFFRNVLGYFKDREFRLRDVIRYLDQNPDVTKVNAHLQQKFLDNQKAKTKLVLKHA